MSGFRFKNTTEDTGHVGQPGHDGAQTWTRFDAKYRQPCIDFIRQNYPKWRDEAEDVFQQVAAAISIKPSITRHNLGDKFRTVLINLCVKELYRMHHPKREIARERYESQPRSFRDFLLHPFSTPEEQEQKRLIDFIAVVREELLDPNFENGRHGDSLDERDLALWRQVQTSATANTAAVARQLGLPRWKVNRARKHIDEKVLEQARQMAREMSL